MRCEGLPGLEAPTPVVMWFLHQCTWATDVEEESYTIMLMASGY